MADLEKEVFKARLHGGFKTHRELVNMIQEKCPDESTHTIDEEIKSTTPTVSSRTSARYITEEEYEHLGNNDKKVVVKASNGFYLGKRFF